MKPTERLNINQKTIRFPHRRSIGTLFVAPKDQPEEWELLTKVRGLVVSPENQPIKWEWLEEARGNVAVPTDAKIKLKISSTATSLSALDDVQEDDLHALDLSHSHVTDIGLLHLSHLKGLKVLELTSTSIGDNGLSAISALENLQSLGLSHSMVTTSGLVHVKNLLQLREIWLSSNNVDDDALDYFKDMNILVQLGLSGTKVTDAGLNKLAHLKKLLRLYLFNTKVSHNGTQALRLLLPELRIKWHPPKTHTQDADECETPSAGTPESKPGLDKSAAIILDADNFGEEQFWRIIDLLDWNQSGNDAQVIEPAVEALAQAPLESIDMFSEILAEKLYAIDGKDHASEIGSQSFNGVKGSFSKNWFLYVRCCAVANGKEFYDEVMQDAKEMPKDMEFQALLAIAPKAFKRKTGQKYDYETKYNYETFSNRPAWAEIS
jgi:hypothetical protein